MLLQRLRSKSFSTSLALLLLLLALVVGLAPAKVSFGPGFALAAYQQHPDQSNIVLPTPHVDYHSPLLDVALYGSPTTGRELSKIVQTQNSVPTYAPIIQNQNSSIDYTYNGIPFRRQSVDIWVERKPGGVYDPGTATIDLSGYTGTGIHMTTYISWGLDVPTGTTVATATIHYQDGTTEDIPFVMGENTAESEYERPEAQYCLVPDKMPSLVAFTTPTHDHSDYEYPFNDYYTAAPLQQKPLAYLELKVASNVGLYEENTGSPCYSPGHWNAGINSLTIQTSGEFVPPVDLAPPTIKVLQLMGTKIPGTNWVAVSLLAKITDNSGKIASQTVSISDGVVTQQLQLYPASKFGANVYSALFRNVPLNKTVTVTITASDPAGNTKTIKTNGYFTNDGAFAINSCTDAGTAKVPTSSMSCQGVGNPVSTSDGHKIETFSLLSVQGPGDADINLTITYNSGSVRQGIFGAGNSSEWDMRVIPLYNPLVPGVEFIQDNGGKVLLKDNGDGTFTALSPAFFGTFTQDGDGYRYTTYNQIRYRFAADGRIIEKLDLNGNAVTPSYTGNQLTSLTTGGRTVTFSYNGDGFVNRLQIGDKIVNLSYENDKLISIQDPNGGTWTLSYETRPVGEIVDERGEDFAYTASEYLLTQVTTPAGRIKNQQTYDDQSRVIHQISGLVGELTFQYIENADGSHETHVIDAYGNPEIWFYNNLDQLYEKQDRVGDKQFYTYDENFLIKQYIDFNNGQWTFVRDEHGNPTDITGPNGYHDQWNYNDFNEPTSHTDPDGFVWTWDYTNGNLIKTSQPDQTVATITYDPRGLPTDIYNFNGSHIHQEYDPITGDLLSVTDGEGSITRYTNDLYGRMVQAKTPLGNNWFYTFDLNDNLRAIDGPLTYHASFDYDADDLLKTEHDADGASLTHIYDERGRLIETDNGLGKPTKFTYGLMNELLSIENERHAVTKYGYDKDFRLISIDMPESVSVSYTLDGQGNKLFFKDGNGHTTAMTYDGLSRPLARVENYIEGGPITADTNVVTRYEQDYRGHTTRIIDPRNNDQRFGFDAVGRLAWTENELHEHTTFGHDSNSNLTLIQYPEGNTIKAIYNGRNQLKVFEDGDHFQTLYAYDADGNVTDITAPDQVITHFAYNALDQQIAATGNYLPGSGNTSFQNVTTFYGYSLVGDLKQVTDAEASLFTFDYDKNHQVIRATNPEGQDHFIYDDAGNLTQHIDANTHSWSFAYDLLNRQISQSDPEHHSYQYGYDHNSNVTSVTDPNNNTTKMTYDPLNRVVLINDPLYQSLRTYDAAGNLIASTDGNSHTTTFGYDLANRPTSRVDAEGFRIEQQYDHNGRLVLTRIPFANAAQTITEHYAYNGRDLLTSETNGEGEITRYGYTNVGLLETKIENDGVVTHYGFDPMRRLNKVTLNYDPSGIATGDKNISYNYGYDRVNNLVAITDPQNNQTTFTYNSLGSLTGERNALPLGNTWSYKYDPVQNLVARTDANHQTTRYSYYPDNQLKLIDYPHDADVSFAYDNNNNSISMQDGLGTTTWGYDALNRRTSVKDSLGRTTSYAYDAMNRRSVKYPDGNVVRYDFLKNDWMQRSIDPKGGITSYTRDEAGRIVRIDDPNQTYSTRTYDRANRVRTVGNYQTSGTILSQFNYSYDAVGQIVKATNSYGWRQPANVVENYTYDKIRRLTGVSTSEGMVATYGYDRASNRTLWQTNDDPFGSSPQDGFTATYSYNEANQLTQANITRTPASQSETITYTYDGNGNRIDRLSKGNGVIQGVAYAFDDENRLTSAYNYLLNSKGQKNWQDETREAYDGTSRRLVETYDPHASSGGGLKRSEFTFDGLDPIAEYDQWDKHQQNFYRGDGKKLLQMQDFPVGTPGQQYWYQDDGRGNVAGLTKDKGQSVHNYRYDAFGGVTPDNGNWTAPHNDYTLTEKSFNPNTALYYFGARFYDPKAGSWINQDIYRGSITNPLSLNRYMYNYNNLINYVDPDGKEPNKAQIGNVNYWVEWLQHLEEQRQKELGRELKPSERRDLLAQAARQVVSDEQGLIMRFLLGGSTKSAPYNVCSQGYNNRTTQFGRYVYSEKYGFPNNPNSNYLDALHFFMMAHKSTPWYQWKLPVFLQGLTIEIVQALTNSPSAFSPEDLPSNNAGYDFGKFVTLDKPLAEQLDKFLKEKAKAQTGDPIQSPSYNVLPAADDKETALQIVLEKQLEVQQEHKDNPFLFLLWP